LSLIQGKHGKYLQAFFYGVVILVNRSWFHLISYYEKYILYSENIKLSMCNIGIMKKVEQLVVLSTL